MPDEEQVHPLEPAVEALVAQGVSNEQLLETLVHQGEQNNPEPILEASLITQTKILKALEDTSAAEVPEGGSVVVIGKRGPQGEKGDKPSPDELRGLIIPLIPEPRDGKDGHTPTPEELTTLILPLIPPPVPGKDGKDGKTPSERLLRSIIEPMLPEVIQGPPGPQGRQGDPSPQLDGKAVVELISGLPEAERLSYESLRDRPNFETFRGKGRGGWELKVAGGATTVNQATKLTFTGATVTDLGGGEVGIAIEESSGGTAVPEEFPTDSGDHINFTLAHAPIAGTFRLYRGGSRQTSLGGSPDFTQIGTALVLAIALADGEVLLADYSH